MHHLMKIQPYRIRTVWASMANLRNQVGLNHCWQSIEIRFPPEDHYRELNECQSLYLSIFLLLAMKEGDNAIHLKPEDPSFQIFVPQKPPSHCGFYPPSVSHFIGKMGGDGGWAVGQVRGQSRPSRPNGQSFSLPATMMCSPHHTQAPSFYKSLPDCFGCPETSKRDIFITKGVVKALFGKRKDFQGRFLQPLGLGWISAVGEYFWKKYFFKLCVWDLCFCSFVENENCFIIRNWPQTELFLFPSSRKVIYPRGQRKIGKSNVNVRKVEGRKKWASNVVFSSGKRGAGR